LKLKVRRSSLKQSQPQRKSLEGMFSNSDEAQHSFIMEEGKKSYNNKDGEGGDVNERDQSEVKTLINLVAA
jgi:hypothetical protein